MRHQRDPLHLHVAAERLGDLLAEDKMSLSEVTETISSWVVNTTSVDQHGLQARLHWTMRDHAKEQRRRRDNTAVAIRWAVRNLLALHAPQAEIEEAAGKANGGVLEWYEIAAILADEWDKVYRPKRRWNRW